MSNADLNPNRSSATLTEADWMKKKHAFLNNRYAIQSSGVPIDIESLTFKKNQILAELAEIEEKNHGLKKYIKDSQLAIAEHRQINHETAQSLEYEKKLLNKHLASERNILNEILFYENEHNELDKIVKDLSSRLNTTIESIDNTLNDIDFVKGEINAMIEKMNSLEKNIPKEYTHIDNMDHLFKQTIQSLHALYQRAHHAEKSIIKTYYHMKNK